jgi:hypothetical protein
MTPRFILYSNVSEDTCGMNESHHAPLFKRRAASSSVIQLLGGSVKIVRCRVDKRGRPLLRSLPAPFPSASRHAAERHATRRCSCPFRECQLLLSSLSSRGRVFLLLRRPSRSGVRFGPCAWSSSGAQKGFRERRRSFGAKGSRATVSCPSSASVGTRSGFRIRPPTPGRGNAPGRRPRPG